MDITQFADMLIKFVTQKKVYGPIITIIIAMIIYKIFLGIINHIVLDGKTELDKKRRKTLLDLFKSFGKYVVVIISLLVILEIYGINTTSLVAGLGVVGLVIGLSLQDTLKDIISGMSVIMDNYFVVGDTVEFNGFKGEVISFGLRCTKIKKPSGEVLAFANRNMLQVINYSQKNSSIMLNITVSSDVDEDKVEELLIGLIPKINKIDKVIEEGAQYLGITDLTENTVTHSYSIRCERLKQSDIKRSALKIIRDSFLKAKIVVKSAQIGG